MDYGTPSSTLSNALLREQQSTPSQIPSYMSRDSMHAMFATSFLGNRHESLFGDLSLLRHNSQIISDIGIVQKYSLSEIRARFELPPQFCEQSAQNTCSCAHCGQCKTLLAADQPNAVHPVPVECSMVSDPREAAVMNMIDHAPAPLRRPHGIVRDRIGILAIMLPRGRLPDRYSIPPGTPRALLRAPSPTPSSRNGHAYFFFNSSEKKPCLTKQSSRFRHEHPTGSDKRTRPSVSPLRFNLFTALFKRKRAGPSKEPVIAGALMEASPFRNRLNLSSSVFPALLPAPRDGSYSSMDVNVSSVEDSHAYEGPGSPPRSPRRRKALPDLRLAASESLAWWLPVQSQYGNPISRGASLEEPSIEGSPATYQGRVLLPDKQACTFEMVTTPTLDVERDGAVTLRQRWRSLVGPPKRKFANIF